jgi:ribosomal protein S18 acetylase RimI-like enzyme
MDEEIKFVEIVDLEDDLFLPWLDLYETAFPPNEKVLVSHFIELLISKKEGGRVDEILLGAVNGAQELLGLAYFALMPEKETAVLWYLATWPKDRNRGLGGTIYDHIVSLIDKSCYKGLLMEVEIPELAESEEQRLLAARRINFYRRHGAYWLKGIDYLQSVGWHQFPTPMYILVHPFQPLDPAAAFDLVKGMAGDAVTKNGNLELRGE